MNELDEPICVGMSTYYYPHIFIFSHSSTPLAMSSWGFPSSTDFQSNPPQVHSFSQPTQCHTFVKAKSNPSAQFTSTFANTSHHHHNLSTPTPSNPFLRPLPGHTLIYHLLHSLQSLPITPQHPIQHKPLQDIQILRPHLRVFFPRNYMPRATSVGYPHGMRGKQ